MRDLGVAIAKFVAGVILVPVVIGTTFSFYRELETVRPILTAFRFGVLTYVGVHLFLAPAEGAYRFGQNVFLEVFHFAPRWGRWVTMGVPLYTTLSLVVMYLMTNAFGLKGMDTPFMFLSGFTLAMHVIMTARLLFDSDPSLLKPNYILGAELVYLSNLFIVMFFMSLIYVQYSFDFFFQQIWGMTGNAYYSCFHFLFGT